MSGWQTHDVSNQFDELTGYDLYATDVALDAAVLRAGAGWAVPALRRYGAAIGSVECFRAAEDANRHQPELQTHDRRGRRIDRVEFHPAWHALLARLRGAGWISLSFRDERPGRWAAAMAGLYLHGQVESGTLCPSTMTWASIAVLRREPLLWPMLRDKLFSDDYDASDQPIALKRSICIGMGMTEKQGGSDLRSNTTEATPVDGGGRGRDYRIRGHKWFFSAPMCDAHLVVARTRDGGPSCFFVPRWRDDGSRNPVAIQRLKDKLGNRSNSSSEVEFHDAGGSLLGEEGRGIALIIEMAAHTRLACVMSSAALIRQALVQALAYTRQRVAFGRPLALQPLMRAVLADLALESEAALALTMRLATAFERADAGDPAEQVWQRLLTPAAKFWVCKRAVELTGEAIETFGGNGYVEPGVMARLFREAPVNSIWEGSGNVMCLDLIRAASRAAPATSAWLDGLADSAAGEPLLRRRIDELRALLATPPQQLEGLGRVLAQRLVLVAQATLLRAGTPALVADAFIASRLGDAGWGGVVGALDPRQIDTAALLQRALPA